MPRTRIDRIGLSGRELVDSQLRLASGGRKIHIGGSQLRTDMVTNVSTSSPDVVVDVHFD